MTTKLIIVCNVCQRETPVDFDPNYSSSACESVSVLSGKVGEFRFSVDVQLGKNKHVCMFCVIDAVKAMDGRPEVEYRSTLKTLILESERCPRCRAPKGTPHAVNCTAPCPGCGAEGAEMHAENCDQ